MDIRSAQIIKFLTTFADLPVSELLEFQKVLSFRIIKKNDFLVQEGQCSDEIAFIHKGLMLRYYLNTKGQKFIKGFGFENGLVGPYADILRGRPARFYIEAIEDTEVTTVRYRDFEKFYLRHPAWERFGRKIAESLFVEVEQREQMLLTMSAQERYHFFRINAPELIVRLPQYVIAEYLGMSPVTLSRLRSSGAHP